MASKSKPDSIPWPPQERDEAATKTLCALETAQRSQVFEGISAMKMQKKLIKITELDGACQAKWDRRWEKNSSTEGLKEIKSICARKCWEERIGLGITTAIKDDSKVVKNLLKVGLPTEPGICLDPRSLHEMPVKIPGTRFWTWSLLWLPSSLLSCKTDLRAEITVVTERSFIWNEPTKPEHVASWNTQVSGWAAVDFTAFSYCLNFELHPCNFCMSRRKPCCCTGNLWWDGLCWFTSAVTVLCQTPPLCPGGPWAVNFSAESTRSFVANMFSCLISSPRTKTS